MSQQTVNPPPATETANGSAPPRVAVPRVQPMGEQISAQQRRSEPLLETLARLGFVSADQLELAGEVHKHPDRARVGDLLVEHGIVSKQQLAHANAVRAGLEVYDPSVPPDPTVMELVDERTARRYQAVPVRSDPDGCLVMAMADPTNVFALDDLRILTRRRIRPLLAQPEVVARLIAQAGRLDQLVAQVVDSSDIPEDAFESLSEIQDDPDEAPVVRLVNSIISRGVEDGASDIHLEPQASEVVVRFRIDGVLRTITSVPHRFANGVASRIKIMSDLDIAERRAPQDGRVGLRLAGRTLDLRVATLPTVYGEKIVIRVLDRRNVVMDLRDLGFAPDVLQRFTDSYRRTHGAVLVTGPTGSGKSTTLYGTLHQLNSPDRNIITVEDPVEYRLQGINQVQVNPKAGLTFAAGLRSILRCDPDVVMIGEVRDRETAKIAVESALTGHLVLATLHTNDAAGALSRLTEMGVDPFLSASAVSGILAQRLARRLCEACREPTMVPTSVLADRVDEDRLPQGLPDRMQVYRPGGCGRCGGSGYRGRTGIYEMLVVDENIQRLIIEGASTEAITKAAQKDGMRTLAEDGLLKVMRGETSLEELARAVG
ncbi:MAG: Flp pilus assembly complex ATPase component TadA [Thermoleophilia bacterium]|nr:Flp pilus assembly complex ATPase component TadA [Thermoleophilia bacterium]